MKTQILIIIIALIFCSCNQFEENFYNKIDVAKKKAIKNNSPIIFDLNETTDFEWVKMLHINGNESMPIYSFEIEPILKKETTDLKTWKNRFYFLNSKNELIVKDIDYQHYPSYNIEFCLKDSLNKANYQWLTKDECKFTLIPNTKKTGAGMVFLFPEGETKFDRNNFGIFHKQNSALSIPKNVDSDFKLFLYFFNKDSVFQISRVEFPIKVKLLDGEFELSERTLNLDEYHLNRFDFKVLNTIEKFDGYSQKITLQNDNAVIEINGIENGIAVEYEFKKVKGKWKLVTWTDQST